MLSIQLPVAAGLEVFVVLYLKELLVRFLILVQHIYQRKEHSYTSKTALAMWVPHIGAAADSPQHTTSFLSSLSLNLPWR